MFICPHHGVKHTYLDNSESRLHHNYNVSLRMNVTTPDTNSCINTIARWAPGVPQAHRPHGRHRGPDGLRLPDVGPY